MIGSTSYGLDYLNGIFLSYPADSTWTSLLRMMSFPCCGVLISLNLGYTLGPVYVGNYRFLDATEWDRLERLLLFFYLLYEVSTSALEIVDSGLDGVASVK